MKRTIGVSLGDEGRRVGVLRYGVDGARESAVFEYDPACISSSDGFAIDPATGLLSPVNAQPTRGALPCHGVVDKTGRYLLVATYRGGTVEMFPIDGDGRLGPACDRHQHEGSSTRPDRQDEAHAHAVTLDPDNRFALVADLGTDTVVHYELDLDRGRLVPHPERDAWTFQHLGRDRADAHGDPTRTLAPAGGIAFFAAFARALGVAVPA